ncbi:unnamed protein product [Calypogeia fissa]
MAAATRLLQKHFISPGEVSISSSSSQGQLKFFGSPRFSRLRPRDIRIEKLNRRVVVGRPIIPRSSSSSSSGEAFPLPEPKKSAWSDTLGRLNGSHAPPSLSDILWPALGGFVAMAAMAYADTLLAPKGLKVTLGSFGAVCTLLFAAPKSPVSQKYNVFVSHLGCAACGVAALAIFGPGWVARAVALAAAIAFMQYTGSLHPPAAGLPLILIDGQKMHHLQWWFVIYPGFVGCIFLFLLQEVVEFLKGNWRF